MKKIYSYISIVALAALSASCAEELVGPEELMTDSNKTELVNGELTVQLSVPESAQTKTVLGTKDGSTYPVYWSVGDVVALNGTAATEFTPSSDGTSATAKFKMGSLTSPYNFLYGGVSGTSDQVSFPATQNYVAGSFDPAAMPMYASLANVNENVTFSHVGALLRFSFTGTDKISSVTLTAADESKSLSGNFTIGKTSNLLDGTLTPVAGSASLLYDFGEDKQLSQTPFVFYVAVPAGTYPGGIVLEVVDNAAGHMTVKVMEDAETIAVGKVREFSNVVYAPEKELNLILINSDATLQQFATRVAGGETYLNARVTADFTATSAWTPVADYKGTFDGNSKTISGLREPLFDNLGGVVKNLTLNSNITATDADDRNWGIFTKTLVPSAEVDDVAGLQNCTAQGIIDYTPNSVIDGNINVGGLVGNNAGGALSNCTNEATVTMGDNDETHASETSIGGVLGRTQKGGDLSSQGDISNCTNNGTVVCNAKLSKNVYIGGILGFQVEKAEYISGCVNNGLVKLSSTFSTSSAIHIGGVIGLGKGKIESCTNGTNGVVTSESGSTGGSYLCHGGVVGRMSHDSRTYSGLTNAGTINIAAVGGDAWVGGVVGRCNEGSTLTDVTNNGSINYTAESSKAGYIGGITGRITNSLSNCHSTGGTINYTGANYAGTLYIGGITGYTNNAIEISNCSSAMTLNIGGAFEATSNNYFGTGGVVGNVANDEATLVNCSNTGDINWSQQISTKGYSFLGGVAGRSQGVISGCSNSGKVTFSGKNSAQNPYIAGIVGTNSNVSGDRILNCTNSGNIVINTSTQSSKYIFVGGIAGRAYGNTVATNSGKIDVVQLKCTRLNLGGLIGESNGTISAGSKNLAEGDITVTGLTISGDYIRLGGVAGINLGTVTADNAGDIILTDEATSKKSIFIGGVVGRGEAPIEGCTNTGNVSNGCSMTTAGSYTQIGGVVGYNNGDSPLTDCSNSGSVSNSANSAGYLYVGGVTSENDAAMVNCVNSGNVSNSGGSGNSVRVAVGGVTGVTSKDMANAYNTGKITNSGEAAGNINIAGVVGFSNEATLTGCYNTGDILNEGNAGAGIMVGGVSGLSDASTFKVCYNTGEISNKGAATDISKDKDYGEDGGYSNFAVDVCIGGIAGFLVNVNTLTGTESEYNYNSGLIYDESASKWVAMGGIAGCTKAGVSDLSYTKNLSDGMIYIEGGLRNKVYLAGILGVADAALTMDYASNAATIKYRHVTLEAFCLTGGVLGGWYSGVRTVSSTITGCTNSGTIDCWNTDDESDGGNMGAANDEVDSYSYVGGICGVGDCTNKKFINCTNTGRIAVYNQVKTRLGGILGYSSVNPDGCVNKGRINYCRYNPVGNGGTGEIGGVVGYMNIATPTNLTNDATVRSTGSTPNCYTGGIIGRTNTNTVGFLNCNVGTSGSGEQTVSGAAEKSWDDSKARAAGLFCSDGNTAHAWDFTGCKIKKGAKCQNMNVAEDNFLKSLVGRQHASSITNAPTFVDSF